MKKQKKTTDVRIEDLARMVKAGFDEVATKQQLQLVSDGLDLVRADIHDIKITLGPLVRAVAEHEERVRTLEQRVGRVEKKVGLAR